VSVLSAFEPTDASVVRMDEANREIADDEPGHAGRRGGISAGVGIASSLSSGEDSEDALGRLLQGGLRARRCHSCQCRRRGLQRRA